MDKPPANSLLGRLERMKAKTTYTALVDEAIAEIVSLRGRLALIASTAGNPTHAQ